MCLLVLARNDIHRLSERSQLCPELRLELLWLAWLGPLLVHLVLLFPDGRLDAARACHAVAARLALTVTVVET